MYRKIVIAGVIFITVAVLNPARNSTHQNLDKTVSASSVANVEQPVASLHQSAPEVVLGDPVPALDAKSILAIDVNTGTQLYAKNFDVRLPIASLTKLMTAMVVLDYANKDSVVTIHKSDTLIDCSCMGLVEGEQISVENLLRGMLIPSTNDSATALARFVGGDQEHFVGMMNSKAEALGLSNTHFSNPVGLDSSDNYSTALDLSKITQEFLKYSLLEKIVATAGQNVSSVDGKFTHKLRTSNKLLLENSDVVGVKTGFTPNAQGNLIVKIDQNGNEVLTIVLNTPNREDDTRRLIAWIFKVYRW